MGPDRRSSRPPRTFAWITLGWTVAVSVWGAFVRATGSGAGCGSHWPLCDGAVLPDVSATATLIEFSHRLSSGLALLLVFGLWAAVRRGAPAGHPARPLVTASVVFMLVEAGIGAGLVLLELVGANSSVARAVVMGGHLVNTFALVAALTLTAWTLGGPSPRLPGGRTAWLLGGCAAALLLTNVSGAIAALGDTLFPATSLLDAWRQELSVTSNVLIRLRLLHPVLAVAAAGAAAWAASTVGRSSGAARPLQALVGMQVAAGVVNVLLLAPVWLQLVHLLLANLVWIAFVLLAADTLSAGATARRWPWAARHLDGALPSSNATRGSDTRVEG